MSMDEEVKLKSSSACLHMLNGDGQEQTIEEAALFLDFYDDFIYFMTEEKEIIKSRIPKSPDQSTSQIS